MLNPGNEYGPDGFDIDPSSFGNLTTQNWVAEALVTYQSTGSGGTTPVVIDVQGDCNLRLRDALDSKVLQMFHLNGSSVQQQFTTLPPTGVKVHLAYSWNVGAGRLTGYPRLARRLRHHRRARTGLGTPRGCGIGVRPPPEAPPLTSALSPSPADNNRRRHGGEPLPWGGGILLSSPLRKPFRECTPGFSRDPGRSLRGRLPKTGPHVKINRGSPSLCRAASVV